MPESLRKVPEITLLFWAIKLLTTGAGETTSDFLAKSGYPEASVVATFVLLAAVVAAQVLARSYQPWLYWSGMMLVSVFGTMAADILHVVVGVPYELSTAFWALALAAVFLVWRGVEKTLSIHSIETRRRELFYWAAVIVTFALGTAGGDWTARTLGLGWWGSALVFLGLFLVPIAGFLWLKVPEVPAFWTAYVLTRPLGASVADWLGTEPSVGGLGFGTGPVSLALLTAIAVLVAWQQLRHRPGRG